MNDQQLNQLLTGLSQPEPSTALDHKIMGTVEKLLALENYYRADLLLNSQSARLDETTKSNLQAAMSKQQQIYGGDFATDYSKFIAQHNASSSEKNSDGPELERG